MALDPSIPLQVQPFKAPDLLAIAGQVQAQRNAALEQQAQQQAMQVRQQELALSQRRLEQEQQQFDAQQAGAQAKSLAAQHDQQRSLLERGQRRLTAVLSAPDEATRAKLWDVNLRQAIQAGEIDPSKLDPSVQTYPGEAAVRSMLVSMMDPKDQAAHLMPAAQKPEDDLLKVGDLLYQRSTSQWITPPKDVQTKPLTFGNSAEPYRLSDGRTVLVRPGSDGRMYFASGAQAGQPVADELQTVPGQTAGERHLTMEEQLLAAMQSGDKKLEQQIRSAMNARDANMGGGVGGGGSSTAGYTAEGLEYAATRARLTGQYPGRDSRTNAVINNEIARQNKVLGQSPAASVQKQAAYKADSSSLSQMQKMRSSAEAFETKATGQIPIINALSAKVSRTSFPIINAALQSGRTAITGDTNATQLANAIETFTEEYAKVMNGSTGSVAAASDSSRAAAKRLINTAMSKGTMSDVLNLMKREMSLTMQGYDATIQHITERMGGGGAPATSKADPLGIR